MSLSKRQKQRAWRGLNDSTFPTIGTSGVFNYASIPGFAAPYTRKDGSKTFHVRIFNPCHVSEVAKARRDRIFGC